MHPDDKKKFDDIFQKGNLEDDKKQETSIKLNDKSTQIILPIFDEFYDYFKLKDMTVVRDSDFHMTVTRNNVTFFIKCIVRKNSVEFSYLFQGGGLMPIKELNLEEITKESIMKVFEDFSKYIIKWS